MAPRGAPPDTLTEHDLARLRDCRRQVALGGVKGMLGGGVAGYAGAKLSQRIIRQQFSGPKHAHIAQYAAPKYVTLVTMLSGCVGSFILASTYGKRTVVHIGDIFQRGATENIVSEYQQRTVDGGGGLIQRQLAAEQEKEASYARRMAALAEFKAKRESGIADRHGHRDPGYSDR